MATKKGKIKWFNIGKGYGFVTDEETGKDTFVHFSGIKNGRTYTGLDAGDEVEFEIVEGKKGPQAENVVLVNEARKPAAEKDTNTNNQ